MVKITGFYISAAIILVAGFAAAQSTKHSADPHTAIARGPNGQPCPVGPMSANKVAPNVVSAAVKSRPVTNRPAEDTQKKPTVEPPNPPSSGGETTTEGAGGVGETKEPTPYPTGHRPIDTTKPQPSSTQHQGTQTTAPSAGAQQCHNGH